VPTANTATDGERTATPGRYTTRSKLKSQNTPTTALLNLSLLTPASPTAKKTPAPKKPFQLLDEIFAHPEITLRLGSLMDPRNMVDLYSISKPFHFIMNSHFTTYIRSSAQIHAPGSAYIFPWRCYRRLTVKDPGFRLNSVDVARDVPSLKWLQMVTARYRAVKQILACLREKGHGLIGKEVDLMRAVLKMWFLMDLPRNGVRIGVVHNTQYWTDQDIFMATFFLIKLDMRFTDPVEGTGEIGLRKLIMGQRGLFPLRNLLMGKLDFIEVVKMWVKYDYTPLPSNRHLPAFGIPPHLIGRGCLEGWGHGQQTMRLLRPDELVLREQIRRSMDLHMRYLEMVRWGYRMQSNDKSRERSGKVTVLESTRKHDVMVDMQRRRKEAWGAKKEREEREFEGRELEREKRKGRKSVWLLGKKKI
jgi:hypothetical protein